MATVNINQIENEYVVTTFASDDGTKCDNSYFNEQLNGGMILYACRNGHKIMRWCMCAIEIIIFFNLKSSNLFGEFRETIKFKKFSHT